MASGDFVSASGDLVSASGDLVSGASSTGVSEERGGSINEGEGTRQAGLSPSNGTTLVIDCMSFAARRAGFR